MTRRSDEETVRAKNIGRDIAAGFKNMVGGELKGYTELLTESRREAMTRMIAQFKAAGLELTPDVWERLAADRRQALEDDLAWIHP